MIKKLIFFTGLIMISAIITEAQTISMHTSESVINGFMDLRFGMFIPWGPAALRGTEISLSRSRQVPVNDYDNLYKEFNPVLFNAEKWVQAAREAGMKCLVITAKHHDGFCLWPSAYTSYDIAATPFKKDVVRYHPFLLWFDGNWQKPWTQGEAVDMYNYIKILDPDIIINNRLSVYSDHKILDARSVGDYATPERQGKINMGIPWESCISICHQWAWKPNKPNITFTTTRKDNKINILLLKRPSGEFILNAIPGCKVSKVYFMGGEKVAFAQNTSSIHLSLPDVLPDKNCSVIALELDKNTESIPLIN